MAERMVRAVGLLVPLAAAAAMWRPITGAYFHSDDFVHLYDLANLDARVFLTQIWGGHLSLVGNALSLTVFDAFGPDPRAFFWSVLVTHLLNVGLLQRALRRLTGDALLAGAGALAWGTCPTLEGALGWYAVYGQVLLTTLVLAVVDSLAALVASGGRLSLWRALAWGVALVAGGACFGIGLGIAAVFPLVAVVALAPSQRSARATGVLVLAAIAILAAYAGARVSGVDMGPRARQLLSLGALLGGLPAVPALLAQLVAFGAGALGLAFLALPADHPGVTTLLATGVGAAIAVAGWRAAEAPQRRAQAALWLLVVTAYATIAAGRVTVIEFLNLPASVAATWPRYHYLPLALLVLAFGAGLAAVRSRSPEARGTVAGALAVWAVLRLLVLVVRPQPIDLHEGDRTAAGTARAGLLQTITAAPPGTTVEIENRPFPQAGIPWLFPGWAALFVIHFPDDVVEGRTVRFLVSDDDWGRAQARGGRIVGLVRRRATGAAGHR